MSDIEILRQKDPELADFIERWRSKYGRTFDLSDDREQANLYEGLLEMGRHVATASEGNATVSLSVNNNGVTGLIVDVTPAATIEKES